MKAFPLHLLFVLRVFCLAALVAGQPKASNCSKDCTGFISALGKNRIRSYRKTEPSCFRRAIIFTTVKSKEICADPAAPWVRKIVKELDEEKATTSPLPHGAASAAAPEEPSVLQKHVGLPDTAPSHTAAPTSSFQGTSKTVLERTRVPASRTEASTTSPPATQDTTQLPAAALPTDESMDPTTARANTPIAASGSSRSDLPSALGSVEISTVPATPLPPEASSVSTLNSPAAADSRLPARTDGPVSSSAGAFAARTLDYSSPVANREPPDTLVFTRQAFSGQARVQVATEAPSDLPVPSLSRAELPVVIAVVVAGALVACGVAVVWHYLKFRVKPEGVSREMVQGLLYQKEGCESHVYAVGVV